MEKRFDVIILGAGPAGYVAAIRLAQLGKKVAVVEEARVGGVCLNSGCIPTKALLEVTSIKDRLNKFSGKGIEIKDLSFDLERLLSWKNGVVNKLVKGIEFLFRKNGVELYQGRGVIEESGVVRVGSDMFYSENIVIATGSKPRELPSLPFSNSDIWTSEEALSPASIPEKLLIVGGGVIGVEIGTIYSRLGSEVFIVEMLPEILPDFDHEIRSLVRRNLEKRGIKIYTDSLVENFKNKIAFLKHKEKKIQIRVDKVLVSVGRIPRSDDFRAIGIQVDGKGFVIVDREFRTSIPRVFAVGDVIGGLLLAHKAHREGMDVAEVICGKKITVPRVIPSVVYGSLEIVKCGLTEEEALEKGFKPKIGKFPFSANGRALTAGFNEGFIKVVGDERTERILGIHMLGPGVSELAASACIAIENKLKVKNITQAIHPHPSLSEALMEACENFYKRAIHIPNI